MKVTVNAEPVEIADTASVADAIRQLGYSQHSVAAALNGEFLPRSRHDGTSLREGDELELVAPRQGG